MTRYNAWDQIVTFCETTQTNNIETNITTFRHSDSNIWDEYYNIERSINILKAEFAYD